MTNMYDSSCVLLLHRHIHKHFLHTTVHSEWVKQALNPEERLWILPHLLLFISHPPTWPRSNLRGQSDTKFSHHITVQTKRAAPIE